MSTHSLWTAGTSGMVRQAGDSLQGSHDVDVCIVGGGIAGMTTAYVLAREGRSVAVFDRALPGQGVTGKTTAHLSCAVDDRYTEMERLHGASGAALVAQSHAKAIDTIESIVRAEAIECDFERVDGYLIGSDGQGEEELLAELEAARRAGLSDVERLDRVPIQPWDTGPCLRFPRQAQFHPLKYLLGLAAAVERRGGRLLWGTDVVSARGGERAEVVTKEGAIFNAHALVAATNTPMVSKVTMHLKQAAYMTYAIAARIDAGSVPRLLLWDTARPYHYLRLQSLEPAPDRKGGDVVIVGGEDHKSGQESDGDERYAALESWLRLRFPSVQQILHRWCGEVLETMDGIAYIGRNPLDAANVYIATGDSGMGMTHGTIAGLLLSDLIHGRDNPWAALYDPSRITLRSLPWMAKEDLNMAAQLADWIKPSEIGALEDVPPDSGVVVRRGLSRVAVYRDRQGEFHERSAACTHLGCVVRWNDCEKTWDCPCHGSRFDVDGHPIHGPAVRDLSASD